MEIVELKANQRNNIDKQSRKKLRKEGRIPGTFYSKHHKALSIDVSEQMLRPLVFSSKTHLISLKLDGHENYECILKDVQFDPVTDKVIHFDLIGLKRGEKVQIEVPIQLTGTAVGVKEGGILSMVYHKLDVECFPRDIPEHINIDVSNLKIGDSIHVRDLKVENIEILNLKDSIVVSVTHPKVEVAETVEELAEGEEIKEPEVIEKGKASAEEKEEES